MSKMIRIFISISMIIVLVFINGFQGLQSAAAQADSPNESMQSVDSDENSAWIVKWNDKENPHFRSQSQVIAEYKHASIVVAKPSEGIDPSEWQERWKQSPDVEYIQKNHTVGIQAKPNDTLFGEQTYLQQIGAEQAWDAVRENNDITIALVDTGVDLKHVDLKDNLVQGTNLLKPEAPPQDDNGHGTNVAGVIAAVSNNKQGVAGLVWKTKIMPIKALEANGRGDEDKLGEGIRYAVDHGAKIIVLSVGLYPYSVYMREVVQYAEDQGVLLISASGNDGKSVKYPAGYATVLAVGGATADKRVQRESNYGPEIDVVAPWDVYTTKLGGGYTTNEGTSMAAPQVAGVAALVWAKYPEMKPYQVRNMIRQSAEDIEFRGWDHYTGYGLLRADKALTQPYKEDLYESNDWMETAKPLPLEAMVVAEINGAKDQDWFSLQAPYNGKIRIQMIGDENTKGLQLVHYLSIPSDNGIVYKNIGSQPVELSVQKGKSWIQIARQKTASNTIPYRLSAEFQISRDAFEDNDLQFKAFTLPTRSQKLKGNFHQENDEDWFVLNVEQSGTLRMNLFSDTVRMDLSLLIQKKGEKPLEIDLGGEGDPEFSPNLDVLPGKYYFRVKNVISDNPQPVKGEYILELDYSLKFIDPNEPNDKPYQAVMMADADYMGVLDKTADVDWFAFKVAKRSVTTVKLSDIPANRIMSTTLLDQNQKQLAMDINSLKSEQLQIEKVLQPGTYYVRISVDRPFQHQMYKLRVTAEELIGGFKDISDHWAQKAIVQLSKNKVVSGYGNYTFDPNREITRAEAALLAVKAFKVSKQKSIDYADVNKAHWAYEYIAKATFAGIVEGYPNGTYAPEQTVTRAEMAVMLANAIKAKAKTKGAAPFSDVEKDYWAAAMLRKMKAEGWISGYKDGTFQPEKAATRAEFVYLLAKILEEK